MAGRRAGARLPRAGRGAAGPLGPAAQADRRRRRRTAADRRGRPVRRDRPGRPRAAEDREAAAAGRGSAGLPQVGRGHQRAESLRRRDAISRVNLAYREYLDDNVALADELLDGCPVDLRGLGVGLRPPAGPFRAEELDRVEPAAWTSGAWRSRPTAQRIAAGTGPWGEVGDAPTGELVVRDVHTGGRGLRAARADRRRPGGGLLARRPDPRGGPRVRRARSRARSC